MATEPSHLDLAFDGDSTTESLTTPGTKQKGKTQIIDDEEWERSHLQKEQQQQKGTNTSAGSSGQKKAGKGPSSKTTSDTNLTQMTGRGSCVSPYTAHIV